jgi:hypothetical protein
MPRLFKQSPIQSRGNRPAPCFLAILAAFTVAGCDRTPPPPPPQPAATPPPATQAAIPTTQNFDSTKTLQLVAVPITLQVPESWSLDTGGGSNLIQGPIPHPVTEPDAILQMSGMNTLTQTQYDNFIRGAQMEMQQDPKRIFLKGPAQFGRLSILDERDYPRHNPLAPTTLPAGYSPRFRWTLWIFIPNPGGNIVRYSLDYVGLDLDTYNANKDFLQKIVASIQYDPSSGSTLNGLGG